ncbi:MAG: DUF3540 domain-containing protein [Sandaracinaceae bacterium]|nr:DUF3540 domain-containing protein [Sandaracinaceae bacterium]
MTRSLEDLADPREPASRAPGARSAEVREVAAGGRLTLALAGGGTLDALAAVPGYDAPRAGDRVVVLTDEEGASWVVGVLPRPASLIDELLDEDDEPVQVRDRRGRLLFEYDPATDRAVLHAPDGDLELSVPDGALRMSARDGVTLETDGHLALRGGRGAVLEAAKAQGPAARVALQPGELTLVASVLTAAADRAELLATRVGVKAHQLDSHVDRVRTVAKVLDVRAGRIVERAKDVYREVERLSQTRAGRLRLVAKATAQLVGENTLLKARDRMKVKGERIHLA